MKLHESKFENWEYIFAWREGSIIGKFWSIIGHTIYGITQKHNGHVLEYKVAQA